MGVLGFLLDTKLGHMLIGLLCILIAGAGMYWRGHNRGWDAATANYTKVVSACMAANDHDARTIRNLEAANQELTDAAKVSAAKLADAVANVAAVRNDGAKALANANRRLLEAEHGTPDARTWAAAHQPRAVFDSLRE